MATGACSDGVHAHGCNSEDQIHILQYERRGHSGPVVHPGWWWPRIVLCFMCFFWGGVLVLSLSYSRRRRCASFGGRPAMRALLVLGGTPAPLEGSHRAAVWGVSPSPLLRGGSGGFQHRRSEVRRVAIFQQTLNCFPRIEFRTPIRFVVSRRSRIEAFLNIFRTVFPSKSTAPAAAGVAAGGGLHGAPQGGPPPGRGRPPPPPPQVRAPLAPRRQGAAVEPSLRIADAPYLSWECTLAFGLLFILKSVRSGF